MNKLSLISLKYPILIENILEDAIEINVDMMISHGDDFVIASIMEYIE